MTPGFHRMSAERYHDDLIGDVPSLSASIAHRLLTQSPLHAWTAHPRLNPNHRPDEDSRFDLGSACHAALLERDHSKICVIDAPDWRTKAAKEARDQARSNGLLPILAKHDKALKAMLKRAHEDIERSELRGVFSSGEAERTLVWREGGVLCRSRFDWLNGAGDLILDYKTCESAAPEGFTRRIGQLGYDTQAAFYLRGLASIGSARNRFVFMAQEIEPPYACSFIGLSSAMLEIAEARVIRAMNLWRECLTTDTWPAYPERICYAEPTTWMLQEHEMWVAEQAAA